MLRRIAIACVTAITLTVAAAATAHHAQAPFFDQQRIVEVRGTVVRWIFRNPHPVLEVETDDAGGAKIVWEVQFAPATVLAKRGWTAQTFKPGDLVVAKGHPSKAPGTYGLEQQGVERADGTPVVP
jgi:Family of unknown function (DUF6152)